MPVNKLNRKNGKLKGERISIDRSANRHAKLDTNKVSRFRGIPTIEFQRRESFYTKEINRIEQLWL